jgi:anti-anti-sigma factor
MPGMAADFFEVETQRRDHGVVVAPRGELDLATAPELRARLREAATDGGPLVLDLRGLDFMDTSGLRLVLEERDRAQREGLAFAVVRGPHAVQRVFEIAGLEDGLPFVDAPEDPHPGGR